MFFTLSSLGIFFYLYFILRPSHIPVARFEVCTHREIGLTLAENDGEDDIHRNTIYIEMCMYKNKRQGGKNCSSCTFILLKPLTKAIFYNETIKTFRHRRNCDVSQQVHNLNGAPTMLWKSHQLATLSIRIYGMSKVCAHHTQNSLDANEWVTHRCHRFILSHTRIWLCVFRRLCLCGKAHKIRSDESTCSIMYAMLCCCCCCYCWYCWTNRIKRLHTFWILGNFDIWIWYGSLSFSVFVWLYECVSLCAIFHAFML